ncbi:MULTISPECIES: L-serine ammonia-lyase, iron-sulfur-dependent, subunit alpha [unclassified Oceanispirochaeta]|uniref:L-serine ammonia-lyase, iron-sulfur-dependent, subunit alpha n=1 Tax=unclassified Oceanispirochaeta TaxID=2635722 RepID=UPI000E097F26|nr:MULTISPECIES: L-serine ammonia-lyase, iron-sulfur-dependent, subunit alpha [unclassified Oceanispirochaeta]MBF9016055.1 L-serine ammonia-lyase, iron-sulfur-dependent, subunit alpha [Oceanispirochaeta sp. M2]NPD72518.1 serine dehydratase [Oceanispirochaeta sp. M1]RDG31976.1 serine dehydratase [Oceanispirochaeta sp. M1]
MDSLRTLYKTGNGPSSSHTMGPQKAAASFFINFPEADLFKVCLYGSLALTGKGHLTDHIINETFAPRTVEILWFPEDEMPEHPNGMKMEALKDGINIGNWEGYSIGGGIIRTSGAGDQDSSESVYPHSSMKKILKHCSKKGLCLWEYVYMNEGEGIRDFLRSVLSDMQHSIDEGLSDEGVLPGGLFLSRKSSTYRKRAAMLAEPLSTSARLFSYALAVSETNAGGGVVVTAPTCGASGVLPAVLRSMKESFDLSETDLLRALASAGLIGNIVRTNGSISGAEVGCQGEVGVACAMAAGAAAQLMGGTPRQVEYAAEMGLEHHLGLTCDPVMGLVQIPCIERNVMGASRAIASAEYAILSDGSHKVGLDDAIATMTQTGRDLMSTYRETSLGGLASFYDENNME